MKLSTKVNILQLSIASVVTLVSIGTTTNARAATFVNSSAALGANDVIDWASYPLNPGTTAVGSPFSITSANGLAVTGSQNAPVGQILKQNPNGFTVTAANSNTTQDPTTFNQFDSLTNPLWNGSFAPNTIVYWTKGSNQGVTLSFATAVSGVGAQIDSFFYRNLSGLPRFEGELTVNFNDGSAQQIFKNLQINTGASANNSALFWGIQSSTANISSINFNSYDPVDRLAGRIDSSNFALGSIGLVNPTRVPEPLTIVGTLVGVAAALKMRKRLKVTNNL